MRPRKYLWSKEWIYCKVNQHPISFSPRHLIVGGGGGAAKTGVKNGFEVLELGHDGTKTTAESVARHETKGYAVMNMTAGKYDREDRTTMIAVGHDESCQGWRRKTFKYLFL